MNPTPEESVAYRRSVVENPTAAMVYRVTYTIPLESSAHTDFATDVAAAMHILDLLRVIRANRRGWLTVSAL